jgi:hypothetical protein
VSLSIFVHTCAAHCASQNIHAFHELYQPMDRTSPSSPPRSPAQISPSSRHDVPRRFAFIRVGPLPQSPSSFSGFMRSRDHSCYLFAHTVRLYGKAMPWKVMRDRFQRISSTVFSILLKLRSSRRSASGNLVAAPHNGRTQSSDLAYQKMLSRCLHRWW